MLTEEAKAKIKARWSERPSGTTYPPATAEQLADFEERHTVIPADYRWFLQECGSGVVGSEWLDGIDDLFSSHQKFREECAIPNGWRTKEMFLIGWDGSGSPIGILPGGSIVVEEPGSESARILSPSLSAYLAAGLDLETAKTNGG